MRLAGEVGRNTWVYASNNLELELCCWRHRRHCSSMMKNSRAFFKSRPYNQAFGLSACCRHKIMGALFCLSLFMASLCAVTKNPSDQSQILSNFLVVWQQQKPNYFWHILWIYTRFTTFLIFSNDTVIYNRISLIHFYDRVFFVHVVVYINVPNLDNVILKGWIAKYAKAVLLPRKVAKPLGEFFAHFWQTSQRTEESQK